jgi:beta-glucanase (GH16 family)
VKTIFKASLFAIFSLNTLSAQVGELIWEDQFNDLDNWMPAIGNGSWGWGNGELEFYKSENVDITEIPGEAGNLALRLTAKAESGPGITDQWGNPLNYTSGKVTSKTKVAVQYGMIEARVKIPDINLGGWPAVWLLGTANYGWPSNGEIDMMEMGSSQAFRDLHDEHNSGNGLNNSTVNQVVGANALFYADAALTPENPSGAASLSWDPDDDFCRPYYNYSNPLVDRFLIYRVYWDADSLRFTIEDDGNEHDLYTEAFHIDSTSSEFQAPFYLIANLAIGGAFTDAYRLGDPGSGQPVSMALPTEMLLDYIKVFEWNGQGEVNFGPPQPIDESLGLYTDETTVSDSLELGISSHIYVWESTLSDGTIPPFEGGNGISWQTTGKGWFGAGIMSVQPLNMSNFGEGYLNFRIKIPADVSFQIGIIDTWGNQNYLEFPANTTKYGLTRNGEWGQASVPISELRGELIDLRMLSYSFVVLEVNGTACEFGLDDIYWDGGSTTVSIENSQVQPSSFQLYQNYPNPFNPSTNIDFNLEHSADVKLKVFNISGQEVMTLVNEFMDFGHHTYSLDANKLPTGIYFYTLIVGEQRVIRKMTVIK